MPRNEIEMILVDFIYFFFKFSLSYFTSFIIIKVDGLAYLQSLIFGYSSFLQTSCHLYQAGHNKKWCS